MKEKFEQEQKDNHNHIEDLIPDMPDMEDDEKFRQWLEETYTNEAELIEKSLLAGQEYEKNPDIAEELSVPREKFYQRLKEEGLYDEADEPDDTSELSKKAVRGVGTEIAGDAVAKKNNASVSKTAREKIISMEARTSKEDGGAEKAVADKVVSMEPESSKQAGTVARATEGFNSPVKTETVAVSDIRVSSEKSSKNDRPVRKKRSYLRLGKVAGVAGVCLMCVFAASMTSEANRNYWVRGFKYLTGNDTKIITGNDNENENVNIDEYEAIQDIENKIDVKVPGFYYRPDGMKFLNYQISQETDSARIEYICDDNILALMIDKQNENTASNIKSIHGEGKEEIVLNEEGEEITIKETVDDEEEIPNFEARWTKNDTEYNFSGRIELAELKKIIKEMRI
ncbi:DUF4367 domain-containing protein [Ruminococcus sp. AF17-22AC]|uniref:DUF4367 domain-containing protein n=1 Tax=Ruminococcus sp. AF17-22AC TaxID=2292248 RepID=UPI000E4735FA|nr:DUF4367 domain-containing protein [Ruminococcus sp. AF17-22AC]RGU32340.1 DUF4367 domain-containing protein [Ruminococcus sp. AF17-22AC]